MSTGHIKAKVRWESSHDPPIPQAANITLVQSMQYGDFILDFGSVAPLASSPEDQQRLEETGVVAKTVARVTMSHLAVQELIKQLIEHSDKIDRKGQ